MPVLFETTESVIEVLWDIALAFFVVRLAFIYFATVFVSGLALSCLATPVLAERHLSTPESEIILAPLLLLLTAGWSKFLISHYEIPRVATFRASIGGVALVMVLAAELLTGFVLYEEGRGDWIWETSTSAKWVLGGLLVAYGLMPLLMMFFEHPQKFESTYHGHEKKSMVDAVPTVRSKAKEAEQKKSQ